jgi:hypothetical protein
MSLLHPELSSRLPAIAEQFATAKPFRHVIIDDFLAPETIAGLLADFPSFEERYAKNEMGHVGGKAVRMDMPSISERYAALDRHIQSPEFLATISKITGIPDLLYDPDYVGGGTHENVHGQGLDPHVDFNLLPKTGWHRRLNLIVYLNHEWHEEWGGCLDLHSNPWDSEHDQVQTVLPLFNRCVVFETNEYSWHGFRPLDLPEAERGRSRKSVAIYLYTRERPADEVAPSHGTIYVPAGLPSSIRPGHALTEGEWLELRNRFARLKGQLKFLYDRELRQSRDYAEVVAALDEARASTGLPLQGFVIARGPNRGFWPDGWVAQESGFGFECTRAAKELVLSAWAPPQLDGDQELTLEIDGKGYSVSLKPGQKTTLRHTGPFKVGEQHRVAIRASRSWSPAAEGGADKRGLAWRLVEAVVE